MDRWLCDIVYTMSDISVLTSNTDKNNRPYLAPKRPANPLNKWIKESKGSYQITRQDIAYIYRNIIFAKTLGQLRAIMEDEEERDKYPVLVISIIASVLGDIARGNNTNLTRMLSFVFPHGMAGFTEDALIGNASGGYEQVIALENTLRELEGDDTILIIDKIMADEGHPVMQVTAAEIDILPGLEGQGI